MAKAAQTAEAAARDDAPPVIQVTLTEFCKRLSETVKRPELIGAFFSVEDKAGRRKAGMAEFQVRFDDFLNKPV